MKWSCPLKSWSAALGLVATMGACSSQVDPPAKSLGSSSTGLDSTQSVTSTKSASQTEDTSATSPDATSSNSKDEASSSGAQDMPGTLLDLIQKEPQLSKLKRAIEEVGLEHEFNTLNHRTLFAPTNEVFDKMPVAHLLEITKNPELLRNVLKYHLISGKHKANELGDHLRSISKHPILIGWGPDGEDVINGSQGSARIIRGDIETKTAIMHLVDDLLWPPEKNMVELLATQERFSEMFDIVEWSEIQEQLETPDTGFTFFVPNNQAIKKLKRRMGPSEFDELLDSEDDLADLIMNHLHAGIKSSETLTWSHDLERVGPGRPFQIRVVKGPSLRVTIDDRNFGEVADLIATNGVIHEVTGTLHHTPFSRGFELGSELSAKLTQSAKAPAKALAPTLQSR